MAENIDPQKQEAMNRATSAFLEELNKIGRTSGVYADAQEEAGDKIKKSSEDAKAALKQFGEQLGQSALVYGKALVSGGEGTAKYGSAAIGAADAVGGLVSKLGIFGAVLGGVIKIFGGLAAASLKQNDTMMKSYRDLSEMGSVSGTLEKVMDDFHKVGLTSEEAEKFGNMVKKVAPELGAFGGSVSAGKDKLVGVIQGMIGPNNQIERGMARIGYGADEMRDATADYIKKQSNLGLSQGKTTDQLREGSVKYMTSLRELQEITGMQRDEAQKLMDEQQADARWALTLKRIEAEEGKDAADRARMAMAAYSGEFGKQAANDLMEQVANKGAVVGEASARAQQSTLGEGYNNFRKVIDGSSDATRMIIDTSKSMAGNMKTLDGSIMVAGNGIDTITGGYQQMSGAMRNANRSYEDVQKSIADKSKITGDRLDQNVDIEQKSRQLRIAADNALMAVGNVVVGMFQKLNDIMLSFAKTIAKMVDWINATIFRTKTNYADQFKDKNDYQGDVNLAKNALAASEREKAELKKDVAKYTQDATGKTLQAAIDAAKKGQIENREVTDQNGTVTSGDASVAEAYANEVKRLTELQKQITDKEGKIDKEKVKRIAEPQPDISKYKEDLSGKTLQTAIDAAKKGAEENRYQKLDNGKEVGNAEKAEIYQAELKRLEELKKQITNKDGTINQEKAQLIEKSKLTILEEKILKEQEKLQAAQKKMQEFTGGAGAGADAPMAGSPGFVAKYNSGGMGAAGMTMAAPNANASGPPDLGNKTIEDIIKFTDGTGDISHFKSMDPNVANAFVAMAKEYFDTTGKQLQVNSAYRTAEEQANVKSGNNPKAAPGKSLHNVGRALDINGDQVQELISKQLLTKYGFKDANSLGFQDPPHIQYGARDGGVFDGPDTGYPVMLHGNEAVIPMPNLDAFTESVKKENLNTIEGMDKGTQEPVIQKVESGINPEFMQSMIEMMASKFDEMIRHLDTSNSTQQQILTYTKA